MCASVSARTSAVEASRVTYRYGQIEALSDLDLSIPQGALYALLGANGSGKTTLLQILMGVRRAMRGSVSLFGVDSRALGLRERATISYIAEGQPLPEWMTLAQLEAYVAPLYATWDTALAAELRERFGLDATRKIGALSRGQQMQAALLCALAPRPRLLVMDEPFTGMDAVVKDDLVHGLLESSGRGDWTVLVCSHDIGELELLADWVGVLDAGRMLLSEPMDVLQSRFKRIEAAIGGDASVETVIARQTAEWMAVERAGRRMTFLVSDADADVEQRVASELRRVSHVAVRDASLREIFVALARSARRTRATRVDSARTQEVA